MKSFDEIKKLIISNKSRMSLLIGNGFSCGYDKRFCSIKERRESESEQTMGLRYTVTDDNSIGSLRMDDDAVFMFNQIRKCHPKGVCEVNDQKAICCGNFIKSFLSNENSGLVFTTNYDLILYWVIAKYNNSNTEDPIPYNDGFETRRGNKWYWEKETSEDQNLFFLHGAFNILQQERDKSVYKPMHDQLCYQPIEDRFQNGLKPVFVSKRIGREKKKQINCSSYLQFCIEKLRDLSGSLVVIGLRLESNDSHIVEAIKQAMESNKLALYYGIYGGDDVSKKGEEKRIRKAFGTNDIVFFDSGTAPMWAPEPVKGE